MLSVVALVFSVNLVSRDLVQDLTLRTLSVVVAVSLVVCLAFLAYRWLEPVEPVVPATHAQPPALRMTSEPPKPAVERPSEQTEVVLLNPGRIYRCEQAGRVVYSDRPCGAAARAIK
jgi:hypothetical protein